MCDSQVYQCTTAEEHTKLSLTDLAPKLEDDGTSLLTPWMLGHYRQSMYTDGKRGHSTHTAQDLVRAFHLV